jgi:hypothetical protein
VTHRTGDDGSAEVGQFVRSSRAAAAVPSPAPRSTSGRSRRTRPCSRLSTSKSLSGITEGGDQGSALTNQHYAPIIAVIVAFVASRVFVTQIITAIGSMTGHHRVGDTIVGVIVGLAPIAVLAWYAALRFRGLDTNHRRWFKIVALVGWLLAGTVLGILPYSRFGTRMDLLSKFRAAAPGLLHALDVTIAVDLLITVVLLLISLRIDDPRRRPD